MINLFVYIVNLRQEKTKSNPKVQLRMVRKEPCYVTLYIQRERLRT